MRCPVGCCAGVAGETVLWLSQKLGREEVSWHSWTTGREMRQQDLPPQCSSQRSWKAHLIPPQQKLSKSQGGWGQLGPTGHWAIRTPAPPPNPSAELSPSPGTPSPDSHALPLPAQVTRREQRLWQATVPPSPSPQLQPGLARVRPRSSPEREEPRGWGWGAGQGGGPHAEDWVCRQEGRCSKKQRGESRE